MSPMLRLLFAAGAACSDGLRFGTRSSLDSVAAATKRAGVRASTATRKARRATGQAKKAKVATGQPDERQSGEACPTNDAKNEICTSMKTDTGMEPNPWLTAFKTETAFIASKLCLPMYAYGSVKSQTCSQWCGLQKLACLRGQVHDYNSGKKCRLAPAASNFNVGTNDDDNVGCEQVGQHDLICQCGHTAEVNCGGGRSAVRCLDCGYKSEDCKGECEWRDPAAAGLGCELLGSESASSAVPENTQFAAIRLIRALQDAQPVKTDPGKTVQQDQATLIQQDRGKPVQKDQVQTIQKDQVKPVQNDQATRSSRLTQFFRRSKSSKFQFQGE